MSAKPCSAVLLALLMLAGPFMALPVCAPPQGSWYATATGLADDGAWFYLTINTTFGSIPFAINGTSFETGGDGATVLVFGYPGDCLVWVAPSHQISEGTWAIFERWGDGLADNSRVVNLSSNQTLTAEYKVQYSVVFNFTAGTISVVNHTQCDAGAIVNCTIVSFPGYWLKDITTTGGVSWVATYGNIVSFVVDGPGTATGVYASILADYALYYIIAAIVAAVAAWLVVYARRKRESAH